MSTLGALALALLQSAPTAPPLSVHVDSSRHAIAIEYRVREIADQAQGEHAHHGGGHAAHVQRMVRFPAPVTGWLRSAKLQLTGPDGQPISQRALHHFNLLNL